MFFFGLSSVGIYCCTNTKQIAEHAVSFPLSKNLYTLDTTNPHHPHPPATQTPTTNRPKPHTPTPTAPTPTTLIHFRTIFKPCRECGLFHTNSFKCPVTSLTESHGEAIYLYENRPVANQCTISAQGTLTAGGGVIQANKEDPTE